MKIKVLNIGKTKAPYLIAGEEEYKKRLTHYISCDWVVLPDVSAKGMSKELIKEKEAQLFFKHIKTEDYVWLLDEKGKMFTSTEWSQQIQKLMNAGTKTCVLIIDSYRDWETDRKSTRLNSSHLKLSRMPSSA